MNPAAGSTWAILAVELYDAAHPAGGEPIERLWAHHPVDQPPPQFFGMTSASIVAPGERPRDGLRI